MNAREPVAESSLPSPSDRWTFKAVAILLTILLVHGLSVGLVMLPHVNNTDFFVFYVQSRVSLAGSSPYEGGVIDFDNPLFRDTAREFSRWQGIEGKVPAWFQQPSGLLYTPQAFLVLIPFSRLPFNPALAAWSIFLTILAVACVTLSWTTDPERQGRSPKTIVLLVAAILLNPLVQLYFGFAQSSMIIPASVALGLWALRRGHHWLAAFLWAFCAVKPQLSFELYLLAVLAGGWRFFARVVLMTIITNAVGGWVLTGNPLMILEMLSKAGQSYVAISHNRVTRETIVSVNRVIYAFTGWAIEWTPSLILLSHVSWMSILAVNAHLRGGLRRPLSYWTAAAACGGVMCGLSHHYDLVILLLLIPYLFWLGDRGHWGDLAVPLAVLAAMSLPLQVVRWPLMRFSASDATTNFLLSYRAWLLVGLAVYLIVRLPQPSSSRAQVPTAAPGPTLTA